MNRKESLNVYRIPFEGPADIMPAPYHFEEDWQRNAIDFSLEVGTPILAAAEGRVFEVVDGFEKGMFEEKFKEKSNLVIILHANDEYSSYLHLKKGIPIKENQKIKEGELIGYSGISGYTLYPHLHYQTMIERPREYWITIPTRFKLEKEVQVLVSPRA